MTRAIDRYQPQQELGRGAWGLVQLAQDPLTRELLALKRSHRAAPEEFQLLKQEFRRVRSLRHPNLVRLYELVVAEDATFFTMEYVRGNDLDAALAELPPRRGEARDAVVKSLARQLLEAVMFLHDHQVLHRDLKPSNVRVTPEGRLVLLDFGLSASPERSRQERGVHVGSVQYMSPECILGAAHSRASDVFGVGMLLWMLVCDRAPFPSATPMANLNAKRRGPSVPEGDDSALLQLAARMLAPRASARPSLEEAFASLGLGFGRAEAPFVGRAAERAAFTEALRAREGRVVHVYGPPGIGKSRFVEEALSTMSEFEVLRARCHLDELVPFRALDGLVDELAQLLHAADVSFESIEPAARAGLLEIFEVLNAVPGWAATTRSAVDSLERRRAAVRGLVGLVAAAAERGRLVLWIDDLQWGDADSVPFIVELLAAQLPVIVVLSYRWPEPSASILEAVRERAGSWQEIVLPPLSSADVRALSDALGCADDRLLAAADGRPGWIEEVVRLGANAPVPRSMRDAVKRRSVALAPDQRDLLELVLLERPIEAEVLLRATRADAPRRTLDELESGRWIRRTSAGLIDAWHDRIHEALAPEIEPSRRRHGHEALAEVLQATPAPRPRRLARHLEGAGRGAEAVPWYERAAVEAREQLAFERAAQDYQAALRLDPSSPWTRVRSLAEVLDLAGRSAEAGRAYLDAADQRAEADAEDRALRLSGGTRLLYGGQLDAGRDVLTTLLSNVGVALPKRPLATGLFERVRLVFRGTAMTPRPLGEMPERSLARAQALLGTAGGLFMVAPLIADALAARGLREAFQLGHTDLVIAGLGFECSSAANIGGPLFGRRATALLQELEALAKASGTPRQVATATLTAGTVAFFQNHWDEAARLCRLAYRSFVEGVPGSAHQQNAAMAFHVAALGASGRLSALRDPLDEYRRAAESRGDRYAQVAMATAETFWPDLVDDAPARALERASQAMGAWPAREFSSPHYQHAFLEVTCMCYLGEYRRAEARLEQTWPKLRRHGFLGLEWLGHQLRYLRGRVALSCAASPGATAHESRKWRQRATAMARAMGRSSLTGVSALRAALENAGGSRGAPGLDDVARAFESADMPAYALAARLLCARARGEQADVRSASRAFEAQGVRRPLRLALTLLPGADARVAEDS